MDPHDEEFNKTAYVSDIFYILWSYLSIFPAHTHEHTPIKKIRPMRELFRGGLY